MNLVEFPGLGISLEINNVAFTVFGVPIYWYGVFIGVGMLLAVLFAFQNATRFGVDSDRMIDVITVGLICAIVGGRLYFLAFSDLEYKTFFDIINLRGGGIAIYGGIIGGFLGAGITCKLRKVPVLPLFDLAGMGFLIGQALGRWGNFFNQEAFGTNTNLPWGMISPATTQYLQWQQATLAAEGIMVDPFAPVHPTFLYESLWCILGFVLLALYKNRRKFNGEIILMYVMWYGLGRAFIEGLRTDSLMISGIGMRVSQLLAATSALAALLVWVIARVKTAGKPLVVPEIPPRTAKVNIETPQGPLAVEIAWPANDKAPSKQERIEIAEKVWEEQNKTAQASQPKADEAGEEKEEQQEEEPKA